MWIRVVGDHRSTEKRIGGESRNRIHIAIEAHWIDEDETHREENAADADADDAAADAVPIAASDLSILVLPPVAVVILFPTRSRNSPWLTAERNRNERGRGRLVVMRLDEENWLVQCNSLIADRVEWSGGVATEIGRRASHGIGAVAYDALE